LVKEVQVVHRVAERRACRVLGFVAPSDTNLDGQAGVIDAANFIAGGMFNSGSASTWSDGDFTYDGVVDILDAADFVGVGLYNEGSYLPVVAPQIFSSVVGRLSPLDAAVVALAIDQQPAPRKKSIFAAF
jgi:hypothetical protein